MVQKNEAIDEEGKMDDRSRDHGYRSQLFMFQTFSVRSDCMYRLSSAFTLVCFNRK
jgi:hypothetical protein